MQNSSYKSGISDGVAEKESLKSLETEWTKIFQRQKEEIDATHDEVNSIRSKAEEQFAIHGTEMENIRTKFRDEMAVKKAVVYWKKRETDHKKAAWWWGVVSIFGFVGAAAAIFGFIHFSPDSTEGIKELIDSKTITQESVGTAITQNLITNVARIGVVVFLSLWAVRIFVRNYLSHKHLASDASERAMIVLTYVALINDPDIEQKAGLKEMILPAALENIFRHSSDGIVGDDAMPSSTLANIIRGNK